MRKDNKLQKILILISGIQGVILIILIIFIANKYINYSYSGNTISDDNPYAKCDFAYDCKCNTLSNKCTCLTYSDNDIVERIKCNPDSAMIS